MEVFECSSPPPSASGRRTTLCHDEYPSQENREEEMQDTETISVPLTNFNLPSVPSVVLKAICQNAAELISIDEMIANCPGNPKARMVASRRGDKPHYVKELAGGKVTCDYYNSSSIQICAHSVAPAENLGCLERFLQWRERYSTKIPNFTKLVLSDAPKGAGEKNGRSNAKRRGEAVRRTAAYDHEEERSAGLSTATVSGLVPHAQSRMFTEIHQNENPFVLTFFLDDKEYKKKKKVADEKGRRMQCETCHNEFPSRCIPLYDLALRHYERWRYPDPDNQHGPWKVSHKETAKFYQVVPENCIKPQHPHFSDDAVAIPDNIIAKLRPGHQTFLIMHLKISTLD